MYELIRCYCGRELGYLAILYEVMKGELMKEKFGDTTVVPHMRIMAELHAECGKILDDLGILIEHQCCRTHMMTQVPMRVYTP